MVASMEAGDQEAEASEANFTFPLARIGRPEEVAQLVLFLASEKSSYSTGAEFLVDGGDMAGDMPEAFRSAIEARNV